jgi:hypothetical protein
VAEARASLAKASITTASSYDEAGIVILCKHGLDTLVLLRDACQHVPSRFPNRLNYIKNIVFDLGITDFDVEMFAGLCHGPEVLSFGQMSTTFQKQLSLASNNFNDMYMSFQLPSVDNCLFCGGSLYAEQPAHSTVFTLRGAFPGLKASLKCRKCYAKFHTDMFHEVSGPRHFYTKMAGVVQASNRISLTRDLYEFLCESG